MFFYWSNAPSRLCYNLCWVFESNGISLLWCGRLLNRKIQTFNVQVQNISDFCIKERILNFKLGIALAKTPACITGENSALYYRWQVTATLCVNSAKKLIWYWLCTAPYSAFRSLQSDTRSDMSPRSYFDLFL